MALAFAIDIKVVKGKKAEKWKQALEQAQEAKESGDSIKHIRLPGTSRSGPCSHCSQFFHMLHDMTGKTVPLRPLHQHCVCRDVPQSLNELMGGPKPKERFQWVKEQPTSKKIETLGKTVALATEFMSHVDINVDKHYIAGTPGTRNFLGTDGLLRLLGKSPKSKLVLEAKRAGIKTKGLSRDELTVELINTYRAGTEHQGELFLEARGGRKVVLSRDRTPRQFKKEISDVTD